MLMWKRRVGQSVVIGSDTLVEVKRIENGEITLGFVTPEGVRVQRAEKYTKDLEENLEFPRFFRMVSRVNSSTHGYSLELPAEVDRRSDGYDYIEIAGFEDMNEDDDAVELHIFRSEAEAIAFSQGVELADLSSEIGAVLGRSGNVWIVLIHRYYSAYSDEPNPVIRDHLGRSERLQEALRKAS